MAERIYIHHAYCREGKLYQPKEHMPVNPADGLCWSPEVRTEDGEQLIVCDAYLFAETRDGRKFRHNHVFSGWARGPEGFPYATHNDTAAAAAANAVYDEGSIDPVHWTEVV